MAYTINLLLQCKYLCVKDTEEEARCCKRHSANQLYHNRIQKDFRERILNYFLKTQKVKPFLQECV